MIGLSAPDITEREIEAVLAVLRTPHLSMGPRLPEFEQAFAEFAGVGHALAVSSGTAGLHLCMRALGLGAGDEVITTPFSFVASVNCFLYEGARPVFVDIDPLSLNMDAAATAAAVGARTRALLPVHVFGLPCVMGPLMALAARHALEVVEDACEAFGATVGARRLPLCGRAAVYAFYPNKQITTGEGGMVVTDDAGMAELLRSLRNQGRTADGGWLAHERLGFNYRMDELRAALGLAQLARAGEILAARARVAGWYGQRLAALDGVQAPAASIGDQGRSWFVYVVLLPPDCDRDGVIRALEAAGVCSRAYFPPIHLIPFIAKEFGYRPGDFPVCEAVSARALALPFHNRLEEDQVETVVAALERALGAGAGRGARGEKMT